MPPSDFLVQVKPASDSKAESAAALTAASPLGGAKASGQAPDSSPQRGSSNAALWLLVVCYLHAALARRACRLSGKCQVTW